VHSAPLNYLIFLPPTYTPEAGPWPVLCFLHGLGEAAPMDIHAALTLHGPLREGNPPRGSNHFIIVAPQLPAPGGDIWNRYAPAVQQLVKAVQAQYHGDPRCTYLTGFSFGGNGVLDLALAQSDFWAALWAVDLTRVSGSPERPIWLCLRQGHPRTHDFISGLKLSPVETDLQRNRVYTVSGLDHVDAATSAYRNSRIYDWLLEKHL
jgi:predicted peptidase